MRVEIRIAAADQDEDRADYREGPEGHLLVLADGAGGVSGGARAADLVIRLARHVQSPEEACALLHEIDLAVCSDRSAGETTGVVVGIRAGILVGASVGDSGAWLLSSDRVEDLTKRQSRKPFLGTGAALPVGFGPLAFSGRLLIASDGLLKYAPRPEIVAAALAREMSPAADQLLDAARLPSGALHDDVAILLAG